MTPGPCYLNFGLRNPSCQEAQPSLPGHVLDIEDGWVTATDGQYTYAFSEERARRLRLVAPRKEEK